MPTRSLCRNLAKARSDRSALLATPFQGQPASEPRTACWNATKLHVKHRSWAVGASWSVKPVLVNVLGGVGGRGRKDSGPTSPDDAPMLHVKPEIWPVLDGIFRLGRPIFPADANMGTRTIGWCFTAHPPLHGGDSRRIAEAEGLAGRCERRVSAGISSRRRLALHASEGADPRARARPSNGSAHASKSAEGPRMVEFHRAVD